MVLTIQTYRDEPIGGHRFADGVPPAAVWIDSKPVEAWNDKAGAVANCTAWPAALLFPASVTGISVAPLRIAAPAPPPVMPGVDGTAGGEGETEAANRCNATCPASVSSSAPVGRAKATAACVGGALAAGAVRAVLPASSVREFTQSATLGCALTVSKLANKPCCHAGSCGPGSSASGASRDGEASPASAARPRRVSPNCTRSSSTSSRGR